MKKTMRSANARSAESVGCLPPRSRPGRGSSRAAAFTVRCFNRELYLAAYGKSPPPGAMTPGVGGQRRRQCPRTRSTNHPRRLRMKGNRFLRPGRGISRTRTGNSARSQAHFRHCRAEVVRLLLEAYYEPRFLPASHHSESRGVHTAVRKSITPDRNCMVVEVISATLGS